ncbi:hypothetical protein B0H17DRAFT_1199165 [Mycena rosella]|uniref:NmrA-like domain-containing protein n=1 Tax=Mycena rosella TaxID=1033263 RepID=A0AAD7DMG2_MYCRO|nr:hypothetical protein B0H17DRAFT_1199165 [Mycena rosella]
MEEEIQLLDVVAERKERERLERERCEGQELQLAIQLSQEAHHQPPAQLSQDDDVAAVFKAHNVDVVLSTIATTGLSSQKSLVEAARLAAVKLFVPAEYGMPTEGHTKGILASKNRIAGKHYIRSFCQILCWGFRGHRPGYSEHGKIITVGKGEAPVSFTAVTDITGFGHTQFYKERDWLAAVDTGAGSTGWDEPNKTEGSGTKAAGSANVLWAGHRWKTIKDVHNL